MQSVELSMLHFANEAIAVIPFLKSELVNLGVSINAANTASLPLRVHVPTN